MTVGRTALLAGSALAGLLVIANPAAAQTTASPMASIDDGRIEEIVVTATKRKERLQDVPVSVTALTAQALEQQNVREVGDLTKLVPGLTVSYGSQPANFSINMRGIGTFSTGIAVESDVAVVIDEVPLGFQAAAFTDLVDIERIEALRGPQSTLFGKSAIAGVLNIVTAAPTESFGGKVTALVTDDHEWRVGGTVSGPISDTVGFRLTVAASDYDGNLNNLAGGRLNGSSATTLSGKLVWKPSDNFEVSLAPHYSRADSDCCVSAIRSLKAANGTELYYQKVPALTYSSIMAGVTPSAYNNETRMDFRAGGISRLAGATVKTAYTFNGDSPLGGATLQYIGSYNDWRLRDFQDIDGTGGPILMYYPTSAPLGLNRGVTLTGWFNAKSTTQELRLTSPGNQRFNYVAGLWYAHNDLGRYLDRGPGISVARYQAYSDNTTVAAFAQGDLKLTGRLSLLGGLRFQDQRIGYLFTSYNAATNFTTSTTYGKRDSETATTGKVGLQYKITPDVMAYATYSTGYKGQAYDLVSTFNASTAAKMPVPHERAENKEIGIKSSLFDRRVLLNLTAFDATYKGFQISTTTVQDDGTFLSYLNSIGRLRTKGIEGDFMIRPVAALTLTGAFAYTDATIADYPNAACYSGQTAAQGCRTITSSTGATTTGQNLAGKPLNNVPRFKYNIGGQYSFDQVGGARPFVGFNWRWQRAINYSLNQDPATIQPSYGVLDAQVGATLRDDQFKLTLFVNNLLKKHYAAGLSNTGFGFSDSAGVGATGRGWTPARDSFRYFGARIDAKF